MRSLIHERPFEKPVAAGRYRYERQGEPTGAVERWRLTEAREGFHFLRVDLNAEASSGQSTLYHLTLNPAGWPERLAFHFLRPGMDIKGNILFEGDAITVARVANGKRREESLPLPPAYAFWFPATAGLGILASMVEEPAVIPALTVMQDDQFALSRTEMRVEGAPVETIMVMGRPVETRPLLLRWPGEERRIWIDDFRWPLRMEREGLAAVETRYIRYGSNHD